jgi:hypothetical protein
MSGNAYSPSYAVMWCQGQLYFVTMCFVGILVLKVFILIIKFASLCCLEQLRKSYWKEIEFSGLKPEAILLHYSK